MRGNLFIKIFLGFWLTTTLVLGSWLVAANYFDALPQTLEWASLVDESTDGLESDLERVMAHLRDDGFERVLRVELTDPQVGIPVVKMLVPGALMDRRFF